MAHLSHAIKYTWLCIVFLYSFSAYAHNVDNIEYSPSNTWQAFSDGAYLIGKSHGEIDVDHKGRIYVSTMSTKKSKGGIKIYSPEGHYIGDVNNAPDDFHGFVIRQNNDLKEYIYGASLKHQKIIKMTLDGKIELEINAASVIPKKFQKIDPLKPKAPTLKLTAVDIDKNGNIYVVDGYSLDYIHKFSPKGKYLSSFGGRVAPYHFRNCHKIQIDPRFEPNRLVCTDRANGRLVHMQLDGTLIGTYAENLRRPSAIDFYKGIAAVAEISGRVSLINKEGKTLSTLGVNDVKKEINTNITTPNQWRDGVFTAPHGITFDHSGNLFITEWNKLGRILRFDLKLTHTK